MIVLLLNWTSLNFKFIQVKMLHCFLLHGSWIYNFKDLISWEAELGLRGRVSSLRWRIIYWLLLLLILAKSKKLGTADRLYLLWHILNIVWYGTVNRKSRTIVILTFISWYLQFLIVWLLILSLKSTLDDWKLMRDSSWDHRVLLL